MDQKIETWVGTLILIIIAVTFGAFIWIAEKSDEMEIKQDLIQNIPTNHKPKRVSCTMEARQCPDGSYVGRTGPNCEFAACPEVKNDETANWQTYKNEKYGFELKFPKSWAGFEASTGKEYATYEDVVDFVFRNGHQPFDIFSIHKYTKNQWDSFKKGSTVRVLGQSGDTVIVCDGCCGNKSDFSGGGQFDDFQIQRCKEASQIISTFKFTK